LDQALEVSTTELRQFVNVVVGYLEEHYGPVLELHADYYWEVPPDKATALDPPISESLGLGQLSHDLERLRSLLRGDDPPLGYAAVWLGSLFRQLGVVYMR
jgi:hypothetical protein